MGLREAFLSIIKSEPGPGDVHVDAPIGTPRRRRKPRDIDKATTETKAEAGYTAEAAMASERCALCQHFIPESACAIVQGAIAPGGWCEYFEPNARIAKLLEHRSLYVSRRLKNAAEFIAWAKGQGFKTTLPAGDLHVTVVYSKQPVDWFAFGDAMAWAPESPDLVVGAGGPRTVERFGDAVVLRFTSSQLCWRNQEFRDGGASYDFPDYQPHVTITWDAGDIDLDAVAPYQGKLVFGPEVFAEIDDDWRSTIMEKRDLDLMAEIAKAGARHSRRDVEMLQKVHDYACDLGAKCPGAEADVGKGLPAEAEIVKVDEEQRMVYGWASVITHKGEPVIDHQGDIIDAPTLEKAATDFMVDQRKAMAMHERDGKGQILDSMIKGMVVHSFVLTAPIAKALGISVPQEGWIVGVKIADDATWAKVKDGTFKAFSIGGRGYREAA